MFKITLGAIALSLVLTAAPAFAFNTNGGGALFGQSNVGMFSGMRAGGLSSQPNIFGGQTWNNGVTSRPNIFGGQTYSGPFGGQTLTCRPNIFGGQNCA